MKFYPADSTITVPHQIIVQAEQVLPTSDISVSLNISGTATNSTITQGEYTMFEVPVTAPVVAAGQVAYATLNVACTTALGMYSKLTRIAFVDYTDIYSSVQDVMDVLGVRGHEIDSSQVHIEEIYLKYYRTFNADFHTLRGTDPYYNLLFGKVITLTAALEVVPSLPVRLSKKEETENGSWQRLGNATDLSALADDLRGQLNEAINELEPYLVNPIYSGNFFFTALSMTHYATGTTS